jgi:hypothetical protein
MRGIRMRTVIGWMAAMFASALLGAAVYQTVLSKPLPELDPTATVETITREPGPQPTLYRTEVRTVVEPTPTVTVEDKVLVKEQVVQVGQPQTSKPAPTRTSAPRPKPRATAEREDSASEPSEDSAETEDAALEVEAAAADDTAETESDD